jgi:tRNA-2-methylthio-N6-dimethylallyladenosine synthase
VNSYADPAGKKSFAELLDAVGRVAWDPSRALHHFSSADFGKDIVDAIDQNPALCDTSIFPSRAGPRVCSTRCSVSTLANSISSVSLG